MKKGLLLAITLILVFAFSVCTSGSTITQSTESSNSSSSVTLPTGWYSGGRYYSWIEGVWDSSVFPDCIPGPMEGIKPDQTTYKSKENSTINNNYSVGHMEFEDDNYEYWSVYFYGNEDHLQTLLEGLVENGFVGGMTDDYPITYEYGGNGYYVCVSASQNYFVNTEYTYSISMYVTPIVHELPQTFFGTRLPQAGLTLYSYNGWQMTAYDEDFNEITADYNLKTDSGTLPNGYYVAWFGNVCVTNEDVIEYVAQMQEDGWTLRYAYDDSYGYGYTAYLIKGDMYAFCRFINYSCSMELSFANMEELLSY